MAGEANGSAIWEAEGSSNKYGFLMVFMDIEDLVRSVELKRQ